MRIRNQRNLDQTEHFILICPLGNFIFPSPTCFSLSFHQDMVPHIALLGSGGGQRAAVGLMGSLFQMEKDGLLDTVLYLGGVSGSAW